MGRVFLLFSESFLAIANWSSHFCRDAQKVGDDGEAMASLKLLWCGLGPSGLPFIIEYDILAINMIRITLFFNIPIY